MSRLAAQTVSPRAQIFAKQMEITLIVRLAMPETPVLADVELIHTKKMFYMQSHRAGVDARVKAAVPISAIFRVSTCSGVRTRDLLRRCAFGAGARIGARARSRPARRAVRRDRDALVPVHGVRVQAAARAAP